MWKKFKEWFFTINLTMLLVLSLFLIRMAVLAVTTLCGWLAVRLVHAPIISAAAGRWYTDTTNAYRAYSREYLTHPAVQPLRPIFMGYELLAYLSIRASRLGLKTCEVPVTRAYPASGRTPTKISGMKGNSELMRVLLEAARGKYDPE